MASLESDGTAAPSQQGSTVETAPFSTLRQLFSQQLAQLVATLDEAPPAPASDDPVSARVDRIVEAIFGCTGSRETGAVVGSSDVAPWKLETRRVIIETELDNLVQQAAVFPTTTEQQKQLESRLDLVLTFVERGFVDENVPLQTLSGLFELRPISACEPLLSYIESRVERLTKGMEYQRGRGPILLRLLNDLLRRLPRSKPGPVILSGRILMLLSSVYPLGEKSGVNLRGNFNTAKGTVWEQDEANPPPPPSVKAVDDESGQKPATAVDGPSQEKKDDKMEVEEGEEGEEAEEEEKQKASTSEGPSFYSTFWSLQRFFNNPHLLFVSTPPNAKRAASSTTSSTAATAPPSPLAQLHDPLATVLTAFARETKKEKELSGSTSSSSSSKKNGDGGDRDTKGKQPATLAPTAKIQDESLLDKTEESLEQYFFPKFLTSRNLLKLELADPTFRLQFLVQTLILTQYLLSLTPVARARAQALPLTNTSAFPSYVVGAEDEARVKDVEDKSWREIENMQGGRQVKRAIERVLQRERNWTDWKLRSCAPFTKPQLDSAAASNAAATKLRMMTRPPPKFPYRLGNSRLSRVWMNDLQTLEGFEPDVADDEFDSIVREWRMTKKKLEMTRKQLDQVGPSHPKSNELRASLEPMTIKLQALHFRALRSASTRYLRHFSRIGSGDLDKLLDEIEKERRRVEEQAEEAETLLGQEVGGGGGGGGGPTERNNNDDDDKDEKDEVEDDEEEADARQVEAELTGNKRGASSVPGGEQVVVVVDEDEATTANDRAESSSTTAADVAADTKAAIRLGDTPLREDTIDEEGEQEEKKQDEGHEKEDELQAQTPRLEEGDANQAVVEPPETAGDATLASPSPSRSTSTKPSSSRRPVVVVEGDEDKGKEGSNEANVDPAGRTTPKRPREEEEEGLKHEGGGQVVVGDTDMADADQETTGGSSHKKQKI